MSSFTISAEQRATIVGQIGTGTVLSISGGRVHPLPDGIELPVSHGYRARVRLTPADDYTVERVFIRDGTEYPKGERTQVYCDQVGETAYRAGMFRSWTEEDW